METLSRNEMKMMFWNFMTADQLRAYVDDLESRMRMLADNYIRSDVKTYKEEFDQLLLIKNDAQSVLNDKSL